jgi:hypothetical protein
VSAVCCSTKAPPPQAICVDVLAGSRSAPPRAGTLSLVGERFGRVRTILHPDWQRDDSAAGCCLTQTSWLCCRLQPALSPPSGLLARCRFNTCDSDDSSSLHQKKEAALKLMLLGSPNWSPFPCCPTWQSPERGARPRTHPPSELLGWLSCCWGRWVWGALVVAP